MKHVHICGQGHSDILMFKCLQSAGKKASASVRECIIVCVCVCVRVCMHVCVCVCVVRRLRTVYLITRWCWRH